MSDCKKLPRARVLPCGTPLGEWAEERKEHIDGRPVVVSVSGGKDSTAVCLLLKEAGIPFTAVHMDTGWEHPDTERYVRDDLPRVIGPIEIVQSERGGMVEWIRRKASFPSRMRRWCTEELKVKPLKAWLAQQDDEIVKVVGIRRAESKARSEMTEWEWSKGFDCEVWRPIIHWSYEDVIDAHKRAGVVPNPLYLKGAERVGCWPCVYARKDEIRLVGELSPDRVDLLERLEEEVTEAGNARLAERGKPPQDHWGFFQARLGERDPETGETRYPCWPIRKVVDWSKTARGGRQLTMFGQPADEGCMRWGMCDHGSRGHDLDPPLAAPLSHADSALDNLGFHEDGKRSHVVWVTANVPLPPKEVQGEVEG